MKRWPYCTIAAAVLSLLSVPRAAQAYRPFDGTDAAVAELGEFELELGPLQMLHQKQRDFLLAPATVLNLGIFPRTELVVDFVGDVPLHHQRTESRYQLRDTDVFLKFLVRKGVLQQDSGPSIAVEAGPLIPELYGDKGFGASANVIVSEQVGWFVAHLNSLAELSRGHLNFAWTSTLITEFRVNEIVWPVAELCWTREVIPGASTYSALGGFIWSVTEGINVDGAAMIASVAGQPAFQARLGFTWALQVWGEHAQEGGEENNVHASGTGTSHGTRRSRALALGKSNTEL